MRQLYRKAYYFYFILLFALSLVLLYPIFRLFLLSSSGQQSAHQLRKLGIRILMVPTGLSVQTLGKENIPKDRQYLICSNHASHIDTLAILAVFPGFYRFLAKAELLKIPFLGMFFKTIDIPVDRSTAAGGKKAFAQAESRVERGDAMVFYAEGGIRPGSPRLQPFKNGVFLLAMKYKVPILPVTLLKTWERFPDETSWATPGPMQVKVHQPILPEHFPTKLEELKESVYNLINEPLNEYLDGSER